MDLNIEKIKNKKIITIVIFTLILLVILGFAVYALIWNKPKNIFLKNINNEYKKFNSLLVENVDVNSLISSLEFDFNINVSELFKSEFSEEDLKLIEELNALNFKMDMSADKENKLLSFVVDTKYNNDSLINIGAYGKPDSIYLELKDLYDKYIEMPVEEYETLFEESNVNIDDVEYVTTKIKDTILNNLDEKDFEKTSEKININGEDIKTTKVTFVLTQQKMINIYINTLKELKEDTKFINKVSSLYSVSVDEIKKEIDEMISVLNEELNAADTKDELIISMYTKGITNDAIKYVIKIEDNEIIYTDYKEKINLLFKDSEETYLTLTNEKVDELYNTEIIMDTIKITIDSKEEDKSWNHSYKLVESESMMQISGEFSYKIEEISKNKEYKEDLNLTISIGAMGISIINMDMNVKGITKYNETITLPDVSNKVLYTDLKEEELNKIMEKLMSNETLVNFINTMDELTAEDSYEEL